MSTDTDMIFGAAALAGLKGQQFEDRRDTADEAELAREEGLTRMRNRIAEENSPSGWVNKQTGKPIKQSEIDKVPPDQRATQADYALEVAKKGYKAKLEWEAPEQQRIRAEEAADLETRNATIMEKERLKQAGQTQRKQMDITSEQAKEAKAQKKEALKSAKERKKWNKNVATQREKKREEYQMYLDENAAVESAMPFGIGDKEATPTMEFEQWFDTTYPRLAEVYSYEEEDAPESKVGGKVDDKNAPDGMQLLDALEASFSPNKQGSQKEDGMGNVSTGQDVVQYDTEVQPTPNSQGLLNTNPDNAEPTKKPTQTGMYGGVTENPMNKVGTGGKEFSLNESIPQMMAKWKKEGASMDDVKADILAAMDPEEREAFLALSPEDQEKRIQELLKGTA